MAGRPIVQRQPNERLQALIHEAGCSNAGLARRVNLCGAEHGLDFRYDKTSVARWLRGQHPRGRAPAMIAEALGRKLGRSVTLDEIGMADSKHLSSAVGLRYALGLAEALDQACELWRSDVGRREFLTGAAPVPAALVEPSRDWLISSLGPHATQALTPVNAPPRGGVRVGRADVAAVRAATDGMMRLDHRFGGGHVRPVAVHYLNSVVAGLLGGSYTEQTGRELYAAAARLTELAGYMAVDTGRTGLAQRYYIQALRLAEAAADRGFGAYVLAAGMSHLAAGLGNAREAVQLARAALEGSRGKVPARAEALFHAAEARGAAGLGDGKSCRDAATRALSALERAGSDASDPGWCRRFDHAYLADELAHCHRDLGQPGAAARRAREALAGHPESRVRRRVIGLALLAAAQAEQREVEEACRTGTRAVDLLEAVRSTRAAEYVAEVTRALQPFDQEPAVREFRERAEGAGPSPAALASG